MDLWLSLAEPPRTMRESPPPPLDESVEHFIRGDEAAGDAICRALEPALRAVVRRILSPGDPDADDIVQDTLLAVLGYLRRTGLHPRNNEAFACTIARNRCVNLLLWRQRRRASDIDKFAESIPDVAASPLELIDEQSSRALLGKVLARLDRACRELLESIYRSEIPIEELRGRLGLKSVQAVYYRKDVCIRKAQKILNQLLLGSLRAERGEIPRKHPERTDD